MTSLRVLSVAHNAVAASNRRRVEALQALPDVEVNLLTPRWWFEEGRRIEVERAAPWRVGRTVFTGNGTRYLYASGLLSAIKGTRPHVVDLFEEPFSLVALQTLLLRDLFAPNAAFVFYSAVNVERRWRWPYREIEQFVLARADAAHAPNADVPRVLAAKGFTRQVAVIPLGVDSGRFADATPMELKGIERPRIGFIGRLEPVKGLGVLLEAFSKIHSEASLVVAGDGPERARVKGERVYALGAVDYGQVASFLKALDVLVLPSVTILPLHREQFGRVLVEAMASGVPVVGSDSGAIPEVIGDAGLVVPERDARSLADALDRVLNDAALRETLIARGRARAQREFAWPVVARKTVELFRTAALHRRATARGLAEVTV